MKHHNILKTEDDRWDWVETILHSLRELNYSWDEISVCTGRTRAAWHHVRKNSRVPSDRFINHVANTLIRYGFEVNTEKWLKASKRKDAKLLVEPSKSSYEDDYLKATTRPSINLRMKSNIEQNLKNPSERIEWIKEVVRVLREGGMRWVDIQRVTGRNERTFYRNMRENCKPSSAFLTHVRNELTKNGYIVDTNAWLNQTGKLLFKASELSPTTNDIEEKGLGKSLAFRFTIEVFDKTDTAMQWTEQGCFSIPKLITKSVVHSGKNESFDEVLQMFFNSLSSLRTKYELEHKKN